MRRKYERSYVTFTKQIPQILIFSIFFIGIIVGSLFSNSLDSSLDKSVADIAQLVDGFIVNINSKQIPNSYLLARSFLTYSKQVVLIWLFGLFPITIPLIGLLVGAQGFSYGFTTSFFIMQYNLNGFLLCFAAYGVQGALFVYMIFMLSSEAMRLGRKDIGINQKTYVIYLLIGIVGAAIISLYESYLVPIIIQYIIGVFF